jgi:hypothetical protein
LSTVPTPKWDELWIFIYFYQFSSGAIDTTRADLWAVFLLLMPIGNRLLSVPVDTGIFRQEIAQN